jgi:hypothetical protein
VQSTSPIVFDAGDLVFKQCGALPYSRQGALMYRHPNEPLRVRVHLQMKTMATLERNDKEATAVARVADAAREVQAASVALEERFKESTDGAAPTLQLARLTAAMNELQAARDALDALLAERSTVKQPRKRDG